MAFAQTNSLSVSKSNLQTNSIGVVAIPLLTPTSEGDYFKVGIKQKKIMYNEESLSKLINDQTFKLNEIGVKLDRVTSLYNQINAERLELEAERKRLYTEIEQLQFQLIQLNLS